MPDVASFLDLPYTKILERDEDGFVIARIEELPGCIAHGQTEEEALSLLREAQKAWVAEVLEQGQQPPLPQSQQQEFSGKWVQRVPKSLHRRLVNLAKEEDTSLNQLVTTILAEALSLRELWHRNVVAHGHPEEVRYKGWRMDKHTDLSVRYTETLRRKFDEYTSANVDEENDYAKED